MAEIVILTSEELDSFKAELLREFRKFKKPDPRPKWLRSSEVCEMLSISPSVLQQLRINGDIPSTKLSTGTWLYPLDGVVDALESRTRGGKEVSYAK